MKPRRKKSLTLDDLASMVAQGFAETASKSETATKRDIADMATKKDIAGLDKRLVNVESDVSKVSERLARVEIKLDRALYKEIDRLENLIRQLAHKVHIKLEY